MGKAERTRQMIIEKASAIFNIKGIAGTSVEEILKASKVARGCLYGHFESKEELAYACVDYLLSAVSNRRDLMMSRERTARSKVYAFMEMSKNPLNYFIDGGCPLINLSTESDDTMPVIKKKIRVDIDGYTEVFTRIIQDGINSGEFSKELDAEEYAMKMFTAIEGATVIARIKNSLKPMQLVIKSLRKELDGYCTQEVAAHFA